MARLSFEDQLKNTLKTDQILEAYNQGKQFQIARFKSKYPPAPGEGQPPNADNIATRDYKKGLLDKGKTNVQVQDEQRRNERLNQLLQIEGDQLPLDLENLNRKLNKEYQNKKNPRKPGFGSSTTDDMTTDGPYDKDWPAPNPLKIIQDVAPAILPLIYQLLINPQGQMASGITDPNMDILLPFPVEDGSGVPWDTPAEPSEDLPEGWGGINNPMLIADFIEAQPWNQNPDNMPVLHEGMKDLEYDPGILIRDKEGRHQFGSFEEVPISA